MDVIRNSQGVSVAASQTDARVSRNVRMLRPEDRIRPIFTICLSAVTRTTGITFKLKDSHDGVNFADVGDQSEVAIAAAKTAASANGVSAADNEFTSEAHGFVTGQALLYMAGSAAVPGLTTGTVYFCVKTGDDTFKLATTQDRAFQGLVVDITGTGTGTQSFFSAHLEIRMINEDSSDQAQLPLKEYVAVFVTTGSGDDVTVSNCFTPGG